MTPEEQKGQRITVAIALLAGGWPVATLVIAILAGVRIPASVWLFQGGVPVGLAWMLIRGRRWVRAITVIGFIFGALGALTRLSQSPTVWMLLSESTVATVDALAAVLLLMSPAVDAYFQARNSLISLNLTGD